MRWDSDRWRGCWARTFPRARRRRAWPASISTAVAASPSPSCAPGTLRWRQPLDLVPWSDRQRCTMGHPSCRRWASHDKAADAGEGATADSGVLPVLLQRLRSTSYVQMVRALATPRHPDIPVCPCCWPLTIVRVSSLLAQRRSCWDGRRGGGRHKRSSVAESWTITPFGILITSLLIHLQTDC